MLPYMEVSILSINRVLTHNKPVGAYDVTLAPQTTTGDLRVYVNNINVEPKPDILNTTIPPVWHVDTQCNVLSATDVTDDVTSFLYYPAW